jgi:ornithine cyclodeaminase
MPATEPRWITEADVAAAIDLPGSVDAIRDALVREHAGTATTLAKTATSIGQHGTLHSLGGTGIAIDGDEIVGTKSWAHTPGGATPLVLLWEAATGALLAVIEAFALGQLRTAGVSAIATDALSRTDANVFAMIGTGKQALAQVAAVASQRPLRQVRVFSPTPEHRAAFCAAVAGRLPGVQVVDCADVPAATDGADVITTATRSRTPILDALLVGPDAHVNALGAITSDRRELDDSVVVASRVVVSDSPDAALALSCELDCAAAVVPLSGVVSAPAAGTRTAGVSVFKAMGLGLADIAIAAAVLAAVRVTGSGRPIPAPVRAAPTLFTSLEVAHE